LLQAVGMTARSKSLVPLLLLLAAFSPVTAYACPLCDSPQAVEVRAGLVDELTPTTLAAVTVPFLIVAGVISVVHFGLPSWRKAR
jgi:hypothetical protein